MLKRLIFGLVFGLLVGGLLAAAVVKGIGLLAFASSGAGVALAYVFAAVTGILVGLVAGKPIWASGGQIEAGLKAFVGAAVAMGAMWAMRHWFTLDLDLHSMGLSPTAPTAAGLLPVTTLPLIAAVLGAFYEADNTPAPEDEKGAKAAKPKDAKSKVRVADSKKKDEDEDEELLEAAPKRTKKS
jgi:hypothetical protein